MAKIAVLGSGPSGMVAAHSAASMGHEVLIMSKAGRSAISGAQYLHEEIPGIRGHVRSELVEHVFKGSQETYAEKVYGFRGARCSWGEYEAEKIMVWSVRDCYEALWGMYGGNITGIEIGPDIMPKLMERFDKIISTIPLPALYPERNYSSQRVWIVNGGEGRKGPSYIQWNGKMATDWYRKSSIFGHVSYEYGFDPLVPCIAIDKPISSGHRSKELAPDMNILHVGRYGEWRKGVLIHDVWHTVQEELVGL